MSSNGEHGMLPTPDDLLSEENKVLLKRRIFALKRNALPPVTTHNMADDANDPILIRFVAYSSSIPLWIASTSYPTQTSSIPTILSWAWIMKNSSEVAT
ncbi:hypothetical protein A0H81_14881 [Grifola frondosa]|uniref:Glycogen [starch] synthase n=1 Tax=Grifola frondosa TaxID=5627 RepID=A0A1C7LK05_GRIFR|nr:hypothetical protein A0H81_14881 [Grifola frondosa]